MALTNAPGVGRWSVFYRSMEFSVSPIRLLTVRGATWRPPKQWVPMKTECYDSLRGRSTDGTILLPRASIKI